MPYIFIHVVMQLSFSYLFTVVLVVFYLHTNSCYCYSVICLSCYLFILHLQFILLLFYAHCLYARALPFTHTPQVAFWRPWICTPDIGCFVSIVQVFDETVRFAKSWIFSLFDFGILIFLVSYYFLILVISDSVLILVLDSYDIMCGCLYVILQ